MLQFMNATGRLRGLLVAVIAISSLSLTACKSETNYFTDENASGDGTGNGDTPTASTGFRVRLKAKSGVDAFLHKFGDIAAACEVPVADKDTPTMLYCMLNMMEYDIWFHGFEYEVNVPENFCSYVEERVYAYYRYEPGVAPASITLAVTDGAITNCLVNGVAPPLGFTATSCNTGEGTVAPDGKFNCVYDYTSISTSGGESLPNCCGGTTLLTLSTTSGTPAETTTTSSLLTHGSTRNCMESPHKNAQGWPQDTSGQPVNLIVELNGASLTRVQKIPSEFSVRTSRAITRSVVYNSGMHEWSEYATDASAWSSNRIVPQAFSPRFDRGPNGDWSTGSGISSLGDGSYQFSCIGAAGEIRHRIRLYLNEWNTVEDYTAFKTDGDPSAVNPHRVGDAGVDCDAVNTGLTCNTFWSWDELVEAYDTGNPASYLYPGVYWNALPF